MNKSIVQLIRPLLRRIFPRKWRERRAIAAEARRHQRYSNLPVDKIFANIYQHGEWGGNSSEYYSGSGSHEPSIVSPYVEAVQTLLRGMPSPPVLVDVGSGDFNVGKNFVELVRHYYACDIVSDLQKYNAEKFQHRNLEFLCLNAVEDDLPDGDLIVVRQVFQHLSNAQISQVVRKCFKYQRWIITEHLPGWEDFQPNADITAGCGIRALFNSGVVLTAKPFNVTGYNTRVLCEVAEHGGVIRTTLFERQSISTGMAV